MPEINTASQTNSATEGELAAKFAVYQRWQTIARIQTFAAVFAVAGLFGIFAKTTYDKVTGSFTPQENQVAAEQAIARVTPEAVRTLGPVLQDVIPVVQQMAVERYPKMRERLSSAAFSRLQSLPDETGEVFAKGLKSGFERTLKNIEPELYKTFPTLADPASRDVLTVYFHDAIEARNKTLASKINALTVNEASRVHAVLQKFQVNDGTVEMSDGELNRELVQSLILLAQKELDRTSDAGKPAHVEAKDSPADEVAPAQANRPSTPSASVEGN